MKNKTVSMFRSCFLLFAGLMITASAVRAQSAQTGSVVLFSDYTSAATGAAGRDTLFKLANSHSTQIATVRVFFINRIDQSAEEYSVCLPAQQTISWRASEMDPGVAGIAYAVATDDAGRPVNFNWLSGASAIIANSQQEPWRDATALAKLASGATMPIKGFSTIRLDGEMYARLPEQFAALLPGNALRVAADPTECSLAFTYKRHFSDQRTLTSDRRN
ncbi:MAG: hypothetical protein ABI977_28265 [Acidobacteriota bacterium]